MRQKFKYKNFVNWFIINKTGLRPVSRTALGQVLRGGHGPGHWQGMVRKVIVIIMAFMIEMDKKRRTNRQTDRQTPDPGGWMGVRWVETKAGLKDCLAQSKNNLRLFPEQLVL
jgi:hypothetical protein